MFSPTELIPVDLKKALNKKWYAGLFQLMEGYRLTYLMAILFQGISSASRTGIYLLFAYLIDDVLKRDDFNTQMPWIAGGFLLLAIVGGGFSFLSGSSAARASENITRNVRNYVYDHIQRLPFFYHDKMSTGELIQRSTSDIEALRRFFSEQVIGAGRIILLYVINMGVLLFLNWELALMSTVIVPVTILIGYFFFKKISDAYEKFQEQDAVVSSVLQENLSGVRVVKAFARQRYEINKFDRENLEKFKRGKFLLTMHSLYWPVSDIITSAQMLFGFYMAATYAINGEISLGTYLAYHGMVIWVLWPIRNLGRLIVQMSTGLVSFKRIMEMIKQSKEPEDQGDYTPEGQPDGAFEFSHLNFKYDGTDENVLKDISFKCKPGSVVALLGSTGSGKTSLVNLLPRFYEYTDGSIKLDGVELNRYPRTYLRSQIGIVEQEPFLFSRTIRENISYGLGKDVSDEEIETAARAAAIHDVILEFQDGYNTLVGEKGVTLSGGQKQRAAIARTLLKNPKILILDDATSSVDTETEAAIRTALDGLMENRTTFIIAHRIQSVMNADLILVFDKGRVVQQGTHQELLTAGGVYQEVFDIQTQIEDELAEEVSAA